MSDLLGKMTDRQSRIFTLQRKLLGDAELRAKFNREWQDLWDKGRNGVRMQDAIHKVRDKWLGFEEKEINATEGLPNTGDRQD
jgi:hypothetical protein